MNRPIQIRDVPDDVHAGLTAKAEAAGMSLSGYLRRVLEREARRSPLEEVLPRVGGRAPTSSMEEVVELLRRDRERRV